MFAIHNYIPAFWYSSNNFGDNLTHYLIKKISGKTPVLVDIKDPCLKVMVTGSILNNDVDNAIVWGCGVASSTDKITPKHSILAVRGNLTGERLKQQGVPFNEVYGDPALLLPRLYVPKSTDKIWKLGILPHYVDTKIVYDKLGMSDIELAAYGVKILDINDGVENIIDSINSCEKIVSSTLHGIIASHAYGVPCQWTKFSDLIGGDDFKYKDYFSSIKWDKNNFVDFRGELLTWSTIQMLIDSTFQKTEVNLDLDKLWEACPFRN